MPSFIDNFLRYDDLSLLLAAVLFLLFALAKWASPVSLVHPIMLGKQADVARVRKSTESAVYRHFGTGSLGMLPFRPSKETRALGDLLKKDFTSSRVLWSTEITNSELEKRSTALAAGFIKIANLAAKESNVLCLLNDGIEWLLTDLALAKCGVPSFNLTSLRLLSPVLDYYTPTTIVIQASLVPQVLELISEVHESKHPKLIVVGEDATAERLLNQDSRLNVLLWEDLEKAGGQSGLTDFPVTEPDDVLCISFYSVENDKPIGVQLTHENVLAGVTATKVLPPLNDPLTPADTIYSSHSMASAVGRAIAYTALFEGSNFTTLDSTALASAYNLQAPKDLSDLVARANAGKSPAPTVIFVGSSHIESMTTDILNSAKSNVIFGLAWQHKLSHLYNGFISRDSFWDKLIFGPSRSTALGRVGSKLRTVIVTDPIQNDALPPALIALSLPLIKSYIHPTVCGPVFATHPLDLQSFPLIEGGPTTSHVGPPSCNIEAKLLNVNDDDVESGGSPIGELVVQGPSVGHTVPALKIGTQDKEKWTPLGCRALVRPNGTFAIFS